MLMTAMSKKNRPSTSSGQADKPAAPNRVADYFWANLIFFIFLYVLATLVRFSSEAKGDEPAVKAVMDETFRFFLMLMGGGFLVVTLFDAGYEFFAAQAEDETVSLP